MALEREHNIPGGDGKVCYNDGDKACYVHNNHDAFCRICSHVLRLGNIHVYKLFFALTITTSMSTCIITRKQSEKRDNSYPKNVLFHKKILVR
jgi:hypothetical protein